MLLAVVLLLSACSGSPDNAAPRADGTGAADLSPRPDEPRVERYVALGDSYTSAPLVPVTDVADGCFRSSGNYPSLVAEELGADLQDRSCAGATTGDLRRSQGPDIPAQMAALDGRTQLVTVSIGGNDEQVFNTLVDRCTAVGSQNPTASPCEDAMREGDGDRLLRALDRTEGRIAQVLRQVQRRAPQARVLAVGYPQLVDADNACERLPLARGDYPYAERVNRALADAVQRAARATGTTYVDVWAASNGHDVCSADPWVNGVQTIQGKALKFHPFAAEQEAVAELVMAALR